MDARQQNFFLAEAIDIGNVIIESAIKEGDKWSWDTKDHNGDTQTTSILYNGNAGIVYYLVDLYKATNDEKYLDAVKCGCNWLLGYVYAEGEKNVNLYCGLGGIIYVLLKAYEIYPDEKYRSHALHIVRDCSSYKDQTVKNDVLLGTAGSVLTLLHVHNYTNEDWILAEIFEYVNILLSNGIFVKQGLAWDRDGAAAHPLCGFSHGASGIAFVFLELSRYFKNDFFSYLAELAFEYEDQYFYKYNYNGQEEGNWPDFRGKFITDENRSEIIDQYLSNDKSKFTNAGPMLAWCHGAPGIGMARLHAYMVTGRHHHKKYFEYALNSTISSLQFNSESFTFCHGSLGNAQLLLDYYMFTNDEKHYSRCLAEARKCILTKKDKGYYKSGYPNVKVGDVSLFMGAAGIGHFLLRLLNPGEVESILLPKLKEIKSVVASNFSEKYNQAYFYTYILKKMFPNTTLLLTGIELAYGSSVEARKEFEQQYISKMAIERNDILRNAYYLDLYNLELSNKIESDYHLYVRNYLNRVNITKARYDDLSFDEILCMQLQLNPNMYFTKHQYRNYTVFIVSFVSHSEMPVKQYTINRYTYDLLSAFDDRKTVGDSYMQMKDKYLNDSDSLNGFNKIFTSQIKNCLMMTFLELPIKSTVSSDGAISSVVFS